MQFLLRILAPLRRFSWLDWVISRVETYTALLEQWGIKPSITTVVGVVVGAALMIWSFLTDYGPLAVLFGLAAWVLVMAGRYYRVGSCAFGTQDEPVHAEPATLDMLAALRKEVERAQKEIVTANVRMAQLESEADTALHAVSLSAERVLIEDAIRAVSVLSTPDNPRGDASYKMETEQTNDAIRAARFALSNTSVLVTLNRIIEHGVGAGELKAQETPAHDRPVSVDPLVWRKHVIAETQMEHVKAFLSHALSENVDRLADSLAHVHESRMARLRQ